MKRRSAVVLRVTSGLCNVMMVMWFGDQGCLRRAFDFLYSFCSYGHLLRRYMSLVRGDMYVIVLVVIGEEILCVAGDG
jgi:hypothetical protein